MKNLLKLGTLRHKGPVRRLNSWPNLIGLRLAYDWPTCRFDWLRASSLVRMATMPALLSHEDDAGLWQRMLIGLGFLTLLRI